MKRRDFLRRIAASAAALVVAADLAPTKPRLVGWYSPDLALFSGSVWWVRPDGKLVRVNAICAPGEEPPGVVRDHIFQGELLEYVRLGGMPRPLTEWKSIRAANPIPPQYL